MNNKINIYLSVLLLLAVALKMLVHPNVRCKKRPWGGCLALLGWAKRHPYRDDGASCDRHSHFWKEKKSFRATAQSWNFVGASSPCKIFCVWSNRHSQSSFDHDRRPSLGPARYGKNNVSFAVHVATVERKVLMYWKCVKRPENRSVYMSMVQWPVLSLSSFIRCVPPII